MIFSPPRPRLNCKVRSQQFSVEQLFLSKRGDDAALVHDVSPLCGALNELDILLDDENAERPLFDQADR